MKRNTKGFYTVEAAICLPLVILAVLSLGYFMRIDGMWENCIHGAVDESALAASKSYDSSMPTMVSSRVKDRLMGDNPQLERVSIRNMRNRYQDLYADNVTSYSIEAVSTLALPLGFDREFKLNAKIKYRDFIGRKERSQPMGAAGLEQQQTENPVWIFPQSGEKYHGGSCTYVKASAEPAVLTGRLKNSYDSCGLCGSASMPSGSLVFCFSSEGSAYHRGTCSSIVRHVIVIDQTEAAEKGYAPCSKCGGG